LIDRAYKSANTDQEFRACLPTKCFWNSFVCRICVGSTKNSPRRVLRAKASIQTACTRGNHHSEQCSSIGDGHNEWCKNLDSVSKPKVKGQHASESLGLKQKWRLCRMLCERELRECCVTVGWCIALFGLITGSTIQITISLVYWRHCTCWLRKGNLCHENWRWCWTMGQPKTKTKVFFIACGFLCSSTFS
jgi:hypothetical protein